MTDTPEAWRAEARRLDGLFAGMCEPREYEYLIKAGLLRKSYEGAGGFMGLAKLRLIE
jgi:hypothetical protein